MGLSVQVRGAYQLGHVARKLRQAGRRDLQRKLRKGLLAAVEPIKAAVREEVHEVMPSGYDPVLSASLDLDTKIRTVGELTGLRIEASARGRHQERDVTALERGWLRHPRFGDREWWYAQKIRAGFFSRPLEASAPIVRPKLQAVLGEMLDEITKG